MIILYYIVDVTSKEQQVKQINRNEYGKGYYH